MVRILIIEDEAEIANFVERGLARHGFETAVAYTGLDGLRMAQAEEPDLVILDLMLPDVDGLEICRQLRSNRELGIIILTARDLVGDRVAGLDAGADDYLAKPFAFDELLARVRSVLRRQKTATEGLIRVGDLELDVGRRQVRRGARAIELTTREFELLRLLAENAGRPLHRDSILQKVWGYGFEGETDPVKVYINYLRRKLNAEGEPDLIKSLRGFGYLLGCQQ